MMTSRLVLLALLLGWAYAHQRQNEKSIAFLLSNRKFRRQSGRGLNAHMVSFSGDGSGSEDQYYGEGNGKGSNVPDSEDMHMPQSAPSPTPSPTPYYYPWSGKGKGKGSKSSKESKKDSKSSKNDSSSSRYGGGGGGGGKPTPKPIVAPTPSPPSLGTGPSNDMPARPPAEIPPSSAILPTLEPTSTANPAPPTSGANDIPVTLNVFAFDYILSNSASMPVRDDFLALEGVTADFLEQYMKNAYAESSQSTLVEFQTFLVTSILTPGEPVQVQWESTAVFTADSVVIPTPEFLDGVVEETLADPQDYIDELLLLSSANPFSTTTDVLFATPKDPPSSSTSPTTPNSSSNISGIIGAAAGLTVILVAFVLYRNRRGGIDNSKAANKGDTTIAGDTFMGDTHAGSSSDDDNGSAENSTRSGMFWSNNNNSNNNKYTDKPKALRTAVEDFDAFVSCEDDLDSMSEALSEALASVDTNGADRNSQPDVQPLDSTLRKLKEDIDGMRSEMDDERNVESVPARRPKSVAEIERLLAFGAENDR